MEFGFSKELDLLREMYKKFAETEIKPLAEELDEEERFPVESIPKLARYGFMGIPFPKEYGGAGGNYLTYAMAIEELGKVCAVPPYSILLHIGEQPYGTYPNIPCRFKRNWKHCGNPCSGCGNIPGYKHLWNQTLLERCALA